MSAVWLAERIDGKFKRQVALKFPYAGPAQRELVERLRRERDILASLEHPNIARLYDADVTSSGQPFLVLEYVDGIPINDYCARQRCRCASGWDCFCRFSARCSMRTRTWSYTAT